MKAETNNQSPIEVSSAKKLIKAMKSSGKSSLLPDMWVIGILMGSGIAAIISALGIKPKLIEGFVLLSFALCYSLILLIRRANGKT